jgi:prenyltransferase beta subunit
MRPRRGQAGSARPRGRARTAARWRGLIVALAACALAGCLLPALADSAAPDAEAQATLDRSVRFLQEAQNPDGGFGGSRGGVSDPDFSAWTAYALAAAGVNPQDQAQPGGVDVFTYLAGHTAELRETTDFDRVALVALASGTSPFAFGAARPVETILARQLPDGSFAQRAGVQTGWVNATIWSIFPLSAIHTPAVAAAVARAAEWLLAQQRPDGSWGSTTASSVSDADMVGAAIQALAAAAPYADAGEQEAFGEADREAFEFLATMQGADGGFRETQGGATNSATTAWVLQGMWAGGVDPRAWRTAEGRDPLSFLASLQRPDGSIGWTATDDLNSLWMTAQVGPALAGRTYPLVETPREAPPVERAAPAQPVAESDPAPAPESGHGGVGTTSAPGVKAGGGGRGAKLFSAPQPQSGGATPHGARRVAAKPEPSAPAEAPAPELSLSAAGAGSGSRHTGGGDGSGDTPVRGGGAGGSVGTVEGVLVGDRGGDSPAAPGLFGADSGGETGGLILFGLVVALLAAGVLGTRSERGGARYPMAPPAPGNAVGAA